MRKSVIVVVHCSQDLLILKVPLAHQPHFNQASAVLSVEVKCRFVFGGNRSNLMLIMLSY